MRAIWKYTLDVKAYNNVEMPKGAVVVYVAAQYERPTLWVLVDPHAEKEIRSFGMVATGQAWDESDSLYVGTFMLGGGTFLGHVIEPQSHAEERKP